MGQTVNLLTSSSVVRIHLTPPKQLAVNSAVNIGNCPMMTEKAEVAQLVELQPSKLEVAGSRPVFRSNRSNAIGL